MFQISFSPNSFEISLQCASEVRALNRVTVLNEHLVPLKEGVTVHVFQCLLNY